MRIVGILSDTHELQPSDEFATRAQRAFSTCDTIIHAGDLTDISLLETFSGKEIYAVHGNMCNHHTQTTLPESRTIILDGYTICLCHGTGNRYTIEDRMIARFPDADCIIFGHTHTPLNTRVGATLLINPGSFQATGRFGAQGSYALLTINRAGLTCTLHELGPLE